LLPILAPEEFDHICKIIEPVGAAPLRFSRVRVLFLNHTKPQKTFRMVLSKFLTLNPHPSKNRRVRHPD